MTLSLTTCFANRARDRRRRGFTITELLVVVAIIVLLAGLLLVALSGARNRALETQTRSTMQNFAAACEAFQTEHGFYPGVIPERVLAQVNDTNDPGSNDPISSTTNALLQLMGGYRVASPTDDPSFLDDFCTDSDDSCVILNIGDWELRVDLTRIGEGPVINGQAYPPYFSPGSGETGVPEGRLLKSEPNRLPTLIDAWGQPILYLRRVRSNGPLVGPFDATGTERPQFYMEGLYPYLRSSRLGDRIGNQSGMSILQNADDEFATLAQIIRHPSFGRYDISPTDPQNIGSVTPRGEIVLISAGRDAVYFSIEDGPGRPGQPVTDIVEDDEFANPNAIDDYDDVLVFRGG